MYHECMEKPPMYLYLTESWPRSEGLLGQPTSENLWDGGWTGADLRS